MSVSCECCVLSGRGLCEGPISHPEESYRLWRVIVCDLETSRMRRPWLALGCCHKRKNRIIFNAYWYPAQTLFHEATEGHPSHIYPSTTKRIIPWRIFRPQNLFRWDGMSLLWPTVTLVWTTLVSYGWFVGYLMMFYW
jgi:hypothetical protein